MRAVLCVLPHTNGSPLRGKHGEALTTARPLAVYRVYPSHVPAFITHHYDLTHLWHQPQRLGCADASAVTPRTLGLVLHHLTAFNQCNH